MTQQIPLDGSHVIADDQADGTLRAAADLAYQRLVFVNVVFVGMPGQPD